MKILGLAALALLTGFAWQEDPREVERRMAELKAEHAKVEEELKVAKAAGDQRVAEELMARLHVIQAEIARAKEIYARRNQERESLEALEKKMADVRARLDEVRAAGEEAEARKLENYLRELEIKALDMRRRPAPGPGRFPGDPRPELGKQRNVLRERFPDRAEKYDVLLREGRFEDAQRLFDECMAEHDMKERDPAAFKQMQEVHDLDRQCEDLGMKLRKTPAANKEAREELRAALNKSVAKLFDLREKMRAREVEELRRRLEELTETLKKRQESKERIVERRVKQLAGEPDEFDW